jgi:uncharacterized protein YkwD
MRARSAALIAALTLVGCGESLETKPLNPEAMRALAKVRVDPAAAAAMLSAYRASHGLGPVRLDAQLTTIAQQQANAMAASHELSHDVAGSFASRILAAGLDAPSAAENIGGGFYTLEEAFKAWRDSPAHNANLLMPRAALFGIAIAKDGRSRFGVFWTMEVAAEAEGAASGKALALSPSGSSPAPKP